MTAFHRHSLVVHSLCHVDPVRDAVGVCDDQGRTVVRFRFDEGADGLHVAASHRYGRHIDVSVVDGHHAEILLRDWFSAGGEFRHRGAGSRFRHLSAGIRVDLRVEDQNVHIASRREHMVEPAVADVICPAVTSHDPDALFHQHVCETHQTLRLGRRGGGEFLFEGGHAFALFVDARFCRLIGVQEPLCQLVANLRCERLDELPRHLVVLVNGEPHAESEFRIVFKQRIRPRRSAPFLVLRPGSRRQVSAIDRGAPCGVGDDHPVSEELRRELDVRGLAASRAGAAEFEERLEEL